MSARRTRRDLLKRAARLGVGAAGLALLGGCTVGPGQRPVAPPASRVATIGYITGGIDEEAADDSSDLNSLREGLRELGWVEGENMQIEVRLWHNDSSAVPDLAAELVRIPVELIVAAGNETPGAVAATSTLPVVMVQGPAAAVELGLAASIQRPGGHVTGLLQPPNEIYGKRLELLLEAAPQVSRVACIVSGVEAIGGVLRETARMLGVQVDLLVLRSEADLELAFTAIDREAADAVLVAQTPVAASHRGRIVAFVVQRRLPAMYNRRGWAEVGGLMSYGNSRTEPFRRAAFYVDRILRGAKPGDLPIEYPTQYELVINLKTADALGLSLPDSLLAQATEVIR